MICTQSPMTNGQYTLSIICIMYKHVFNYYTGEWGHPDVTELPMVNDKACWSIDQALFSGVWHPEEKGGELGDLFLN